MRKLATVQKYMTAEPVENFAEDVQISGGDIDIALGQNKKILAAISNTNANVQRIGYFTSDSSIASIDSAGNIEGKRIGTAIIYAMAVDGSGKYDTITVTVNEPTTDISSFADKVSIAGAQGITYTGKPIKPAVTVEGLTEGRDYDVTCSDNVNVGKATATITAKGSYARKLTKTFYILPKTAASVSAQLYGYDDIKVTWDKAAGASGYRVYYKKSTTTAWSSKDTAGASVSLPNLADGIKYQIKVVHYKIIDSTKKYSVAPSSIKTIYTLKKTATPKVTKYSSKKVKVKWANINGKSGYQISKSTSKSKTKIAVTYATTSGTYKAISATKKKMYYYKVRAYKTVNGKKIYAPWSSVKAYRLK